MNSAPVFLDATFPLDLESPFTRRQALATGVSGSRLSRLVRDGLLRRPLRNVYVAAHVPDTLALRAAMLRLVVPPDCFVTDRTAGWLHGCPRILAPGDHLAVPLVSMYRLPGAGRLRNDIAVSGERRVGPGDLVLVEGLFVTTPLRTAMDLGRLQRRTQALECIDQLLRLGDFTTDDMLASLDRYAGQRGVVQLRELIPLADAGAESPGESALRLRWHDAGLPWPRTQIPIENGGRVVAWLDLGHEELRLAAEYDGEEWHGPEQREHDARRRAWVREHRDYRIEVFRREHVYGARETATFRLAAAFRDVRRAAGFRERTWL